MTTRSKLLWSLAGASAVMAIELALVGLIAGSLYVSQHRAQPTGQGVVIPSPTPGHGIVVPSPIPNPAASRFRELLIPKPGGSPYAIISSPDSAIWFTEAECTSGIGRLSANGTWDHWPITGGCNSQPLAITLGPDGNMWFADVWSAYGRITPAGELTRFQMPEPSYPTGITTGNDGSLWITAASPQSKPFIARVSVQGDVVEEFPLPASAGEPRGIVSGPDGAMWFTESAGIGRITTFGVLTEFPLPQGNGSGSPYQIAVGPDGNLWFIEYIVGSPGRIGRLTPTGRLTEFATPGQYGLQWIARGPDKALWFTGSGSNTIGRISLDGVVTSFTVPTFRSQPVGITTGPDGNIWFTEDPGDGSGKIGILSIK